MIIFVKGVLNLVILFGINAIINNIGGFVRNLSIIVCCVALRLIHLGYALIVTNSCNLAQPFCSLIFFKLSAQRK